VGTNINSNIGGIEISIPGYGVRVTKRLDFSAQTLIK